MEEGFPAGTSGRGTGNGALRCLGAGRQDRRGLRREGPDWQAREPIRAWGRGWDLEAWDWNWKEWFRGQILRQWRLLTGTAGIDRCEERAHKAWSGLGRSDLLLLLCILSSSSFSSVLFPSCLSLLLQSPSLSKFSYVFLDFFFHPEEQNCSFYIILCLLSLFFKIHFSYFLRKNCACKISMCPLTVFTGPGAFHRRMISSLLCTKMDTDLSSMELIFCCVIFRIENILIRGLWTFLVNSVKSQV